MKTQNVGMLGKKLGITQIFTEEGDSLPVTVIQAGPCTVVQKKTGDTDSYSAVQLGFDEAKEKSLTKPLKGHFTKSNTKPFRYLREIRIPGKELEKYTVGQEITADMFNEGDFIDVIGTSKGKGFAGVIKRHGFSGFPASHGTHEVFRHGGSIGMASDPGRVLKGTRMAGRLGGKRTTIQSLKVIKVIKDKNLLLVRGSVPGASGGYLIIKKAAKKAAAA
jgi:large subunit ribosomal protein L3